MVVLELAAVASDTGTGGATLKERAAPYLPRLPECPAGAGHTVSDGPWTVAGFTGKFSGHRHGPVTAAAAAACQWRRQRRLSEALSGTAAILSQCS